LDEGRIKKIDENNLLILLSKLIPQIADRCQSLWRTWFFKKPARPL